MLRVTRNRAGHRCSCCERSPRPRAARRPARSGSASRPAAAAAPGRRPRDRRSSARRNRRRQRRQWRDTAPRRRTRRTPPPPRPSAVIGGRSARVARTRRRGAGRRRRRRRDRVVEREHLAGHRSCLGVVVATRDHALQPVGLQHDVGVDQRDKLGAGSADSPVGGVGETRVAGRARRSAPPGARGAGRRSESSAEPLSTTITSAGRLVLGRERLQTVGQPAAPVPVRDHH